MISDTYRLPVPIIAELDKILNSKFLLMKLETVRFYLSVDGLKKDLVQTKAL